jgi:hypothetical protein
MSPQSGACPAFLRPASDAAQGRLAVISQSGTIVAGVIE